MENSLKTSSGQTVKAVFRKLWIPLVIIAGMILFDQVTKAAVAATIPLNDSVTLIPNFFYFTYILNPGAAFGSFAGARYIFIVLTFIAVCVLCFFLYRFRSEHVLIKTGLALIIAGAIGNWIDRIAIGEVRDFFHFVYFGLTLGPLGTDFAIFNIADISLTVGVVCTVVYILFVYYDKKDPDAVKRHFEKAAARDTKRRAKSDKQNLVGVVSVESFLAQLELEKSASALDSDGEKQDGADSGFADTEGQGSIDSDATKAEDPYGGAPPV